MIVNKKQSLISLLWRSACGFSKFSKRQTTPKILRDHRFTRKGMVMRKEQKEQKYDLTNLPQSQQHQEHLFFNKDEDLKQLKQKVQEREKNLKNEHVFEDHSIIETLLIEIQDRHLTQNHPSKILNNLMQINKKFNSNSQETNELVQIALERLIYNSITTFSLRDFGILVTLSNKYLTLTLSNVSQNQHSKVWKALCNNFCRLLQNNEYHERKLLDTTRSQKQIENIVLTLTSVIKQANVLKDESIKESLSDAASSYLSNNIDVIQDVNHKFLLIANVLPIIPADLQQKLIEHYLREKKNLEALNALQLNTLTALTHSLYKVKQQNTGNSKFDVNSLIDTSLLQKIEQNWIKNFDKKNTENKNVSLLSIFSYSLASMGYHGETKGLTLQFTETNIQNISLLKNVAFLGESLKKFQNLSQKYFDAADAQLRIVLSKENAGQILPAELALQFLRISSKKLFLNSEVASALIKIIDSAYYYEQFQPKPQQTEMIVKTLQKYSAIVDLSNLKIYQTLIGSKKIL